MVTLPISVPCSELLLLTFQNMFPVGSKHLSDLYPHLSCLPLS